VCTRIYGSEREISQRRAKTNYQIQIGMKYGMNRVKHKKYILMMGNSVAQGGISGFDSSSSCIPRRYARFLL
jgi:hypothetical protein